MEVVLTGRLLLVPQEPAPGNAAAANAEQASGGGRSEEAEPSLDTTTPRPGEKTAATTSEPASDGAGATQKEAVESGAGGAAAGVVVDEAAAQHKGAAKYQWEGKWYFRGNKNKSSTFAYEVLWPHREKTPQQPEHEHLEAKQSPTAGEQLPQADLNKEGLPESEKKSDISNPDKSSSSSSAAAAVAFADAIPSSQDPLDAQSSPKPTSFSPLTLMAGPLDDDPIIDDQLHLSLLSDLPSNLLLTDDIVFDLDRAGGDADFLDEVALLTGGSGIDSSGGGGGGGDGMQMSEMPSTAETVAAEATAATAAAAAGARLSDLFPVDARAKCHGGFLVHNPGGEGVNEIAETFELTILRPSTGGVANASYVEVLGEGRNVYGEFILEGKINAQHGLRMICHRRYKSDLAKRAAKATKAKNSANNNNNNNSSNNSSSASLAETNPALDGSNSKSNAPAATAAAAATAALPGPLAVERRASNRITLGVRKTPLFLDQDAGASGLKLAMPVSATFASSSAGKLLKAAQACNRAELRRAWWQWRQQVVAGRAEEEERGQSAGTEKKAPVGAGGGAGKGGSKRKFSSCSDSGMQEDKADAGGHRQAPHSRHQQEGGQEGQREEEGPVAEGWVSALADEDGEVYEGDVVDGERDGVGICLFPNGLLYQGKWARGKEHGPGKLMTHSRRLIYDGEWAEGKMSGKGRYVFPSGGVYEGDWRENVRQGHGCYRLPGGASYEGDWREDLRWGFGVFTWADGSVYEGEWVRGVRQGKGTLRCAEFEYVGQWTENKMEGKGVCAYQNGQRYEGMWRGGLKDGRGRLVLSNGAAQYEGRFREDVLDGQGTLELLEPLPGAVEDEWVIPLDVKVDVARAHVKAGFGQGGT